jgi:oligopeptide/dipeptide ABC transporter ATP-binding protein
VPGSKPKAEPAPLLEIDGLRVATSSGDVLRGVDLALDRGEIVGVVGESGSGKTTLGLAVMGLLGSGRRVVEGQIRLDGEVVVAAGTDQTEQLRGSRIGFVPQDPFTSFDPLQRVGAQIGRSLQLHRGMSGRDATGRAIEMLGALGIRRPDEVATRFPHQLSGGMLQRAVVVAAVVAEPELLIADEPTTALDTIVRVRVAAELVRLVRQLGIAMVVVTHELALLRRTADRLAVMYAGSVVEFGPIGPLLDKPHHHYLAGLLRAGTSLHGPVGRPTAIEGQPPALPGPLLPCAFAPRCPRADQVCLEERPGYAWPASEGFACHHPLNEAS